MKTSFSRLTKCPDETKTVISFISEELAKKSKFPDIKGSASSVYTGYKKKDTHLIIGTGKYPTLLKSNEECSYDLSVIRKGVHAAIRAAIGLKRKVVYICVPSAFEQTVILEAMKATYAFDEYKTEKSHSIDKVIFYPADTKSIPSGLIKTNAILASSIELTKNLQNRNASEVTPQNLEAECKKIADHPLITMRTHLATSEGTKLGLLKAVGQASSVSPRLIVLEYCGDGKSSDSVVLVGKGVTFDSGGLSIKPSPNMMDMKMDMSGAAVVMGVITNISKQKLPVNLTVLIPAAENAVGPDSYRVGDVITGYSGKTVEVQNTDAEGRLILADALAYAVDNYDIVSMVDVATLTGAVSAALGDKIAGVFKSDNALGEMNLLKCASHQCAENIWELPINNDIRDSMKSKIADISNMSKLKGQHGSSSAAAFLESFVGDTKWLHVDIAGTAMENNTGTGWGVDLLSKYVVDSFNQ
jgi:leucyl aminopeptidase